MWSICPRARPHAGCAFPWQVSKRRPSSKARMRTRHLAIIALAPGRGTCPSTPWPVSESKGGVTQLGCPAMQTPCRSGGCARVGSPAATPRSQQHRVLHVQVTPSRTSSSRWNRRRSHSLGAPEGRVTPQHPATAVSQVSTRAGQGEAEGPACWAQSRGRLLTRHAAPRSLGCSILPHAPVMGQTWILKDRPRGELSRNVALSDKRRSSHLPQGGANPRPGPLVFDTESEQAGTTGVSQLSMANSSWSACHGQLSVASSPWLTCHGQLSMVNSPLENSSWPTLRGDKST